MRGVLIAALCAAFLATGVSSVSSATEPQTQEVAADCDLFDTTVDAGVSNLQPIDVTTSGAATETLTNTTNISTKPIQARVLNTAKYVANSGMKAIAANATGSAIASGGIDSAANSGTVANTAVVRSGEVSALPTPLSCATDRSGNLATTVFVNSGVSALPIMSNSATDTTNDANNAGTAGTTRNGGEPCGGDELVAA